MLLERWDELAKIARINEDQPGRISIDGPASFDGDYCGGPLWHVTIVPMNWHRVKDNGCYDVWDGYGNTINEAISDVLNRHKEGKYSCRRLLVKGKCVEESRWW